jgi:hypothetical protein
VALATPEQLVRVFDLDLWRAAEPGVDEQFDADRFGIWLEVLMDAGASLAARKLSEMDVDLVTTGISLHARVFDRAAISPYETTDGVEVVSTIRGLDTPLACDVGGYRLVPRRTGSWDAIVAALTALGDEHPAYFDAVMGGCRRLSNARFEIDGMHDLLGDRDQALFDLSFDRERRREQQGYATPAQARTFLQMSRRLSLEGDQPPESNAVVRAYFRAVDAPAAADPAPVEPAEDGSHVQGHEPAEAGSHVRAVMDILQSAGVLTPPRALLTESQSGGERLGRLHSHMRDLFDHDPIGYAKRSAELAYLANALLAGCSIQARPFTPAEASDAAAAVSNLGLENWPVQWHLEDLIVAFQVGWKTLQDQVAMRAAERLIEVLTNRRHVNRDIQPGLDILRMELKKHCQAGAPWGARNALDVIAILDMPAWAALLGLIDECPVIHAVLTAKGTGVRSVSATAFTFISENSQIATVDEFLKSLPEALSS